VKTRFALVLLLALAVASPVAAQRRGMGPKFEASLLTGYRFGGNFSNGNYDVADSVRLSDIELDNAPSFGLVAGWNFTENGQLEGSWSRQSTDATLSAQSAGQREPLGHVALDVIHIGALYRFGRFYDSMRPWIGFTLGSTVFSADEGESFGKFSMGAVFGSHFAFDRRWAVRLQMRFITTYIDENDAIFCSYGCWTGTSKSYLRQFDIGIGLTIRP
jgi:hypothetical protein